MQWHRRCSEIVVWGGVLLFVGCQRVDHDRLLRGLFLDHEFDYVWQIVLDDGQFDSTKLAAAHEVSKRNPPAVLEINHAYLFYPERQANFEELGLRTLPALINKTGCIVSNAPRRTADLTYPFVGGPKFDIRFSCRNEGYDLRSVVDPRLGAVRGMANTTALVLIREK